MKFTKHWLAGMIAMVMALSLVVGAHAQGADADVAPDAQLFATIYQGACDDLGDDPVSQLGNLNSAEEVADGMETDVEIMGFQDVEEMLVLDVNLEAGIEALFQQDQVLSLVILDEQVDDEDYVVCGELGGFMVNGQIAIALTPTDDPDTGVDDAADGTDDTDADTDDLDADAGDSDYVGVAIFGSGQGDPEQTSSLTLVRVYVFQAVIADVVVTPEATATVETIADPVFVPTLVPTTAPPPPPPPTEAPAGSPTTEPTTEPTASATVEPTVAPTLAPTTAPTAPPTIAPTIAPTAAPTSDSSE
jgi:hypothetical protein